MLVPPLLTSKRRSAGTSAAVEPILKSLRRCLLLPAGKERSHADTTKPGERCARRYQRRIEAGPERCEADCGEEEHHIAREADPLRHTACRHFRSGGS